jgi:hypothetical protein
MEPIGNLAAALAAAQGELPAPKKTKTAKVRSEKGNYEYHYADLADVIEISKAILAKHNLAVSQMPTVFPNGNLVLVTRLMHKSGESIEAVYPLPSGGKPQEMGSALTYARRYCYCAILGIAADADDDGEAAQHAAPQNGKSNGKAESAETKQARDMYAAIAKAIGEATNPGDTALGLKVDRKDREDIAFIRKHGGDVAADRLHTLAAQKIADLTKPKDKAA